MDVGVCRDPARVAEPADLLDVGREDVDAAPVDQRCEAVQPVEVLAGADRGRRPLRDPRDRLEILRRSRVLEPEHGQVLEGAREPERIRRGVAPMQVERDLRSARDRRDRRFGERDLPLQLRGRDRARVQVLVREQRQVEVELQRREAAVGHLARTRRVGVWGVDVFRLSRRPVHLRVEVVELVRRRSPSTAAAARRAIAL